MRSKILFLTLFFAPLLPAQAPLKSLHPQVKKLVGEVSEERVAAIMKRLEGFGSRNTNYDIDSPDKGIAAARKWIHSEFRGYSPRLEVSFDTHRYPKQGRLVKDLDIVNVVATLPGTSQKDQVIVISGHYDSLNMIRKANVAAGADATDVVASAEATNAPGVSDDASGVALVMELARLMSQYEWEKTISFVAFAGEEQGLFGSRGFAKAAKEMDRKIVGVFNSDIIGNDYDGEGRRVTDLVNVYSTDPMDSPSRSLARYVRDIAALYVPSMKANPVFRNDRFGRGGDHTPFADLGFAAIRFTTPVEHYGFQHSPGDTFEHASPSYTARVTRVNAAAAGSLALAPPMPVTMRSNAKGVVTGPNLARGKGYDAAMKWRASDVPDLAGYVVTIRSTTAPFWEREIFVGNVIEYSLSGLSIDDIVIGVKAVDKDGMESPVAAYNLIPRNFSNPASNPTP